MAIEADQWAILVGVNFYNGKGSLKGAVRDVEKVKAYLERNHKTARIFVFTASEPSDKQSEHPPEQPESWPTYDNVVKSLTDVIDNARAGDFVHIHFSGHGTRFVTTAKYGNKVTGDLSLVLYEENELGFSYLKGSKLGNLLKCMIDKGLKVTLVLDCCFSGSVMRCDDSDFRIRTLPYNDNADTNSPGVLREARVQDKGLLDSEGYAVLCACGPEEDSGEYQFDDTLGVHYGALTYLLDIALKPCGSGTKLSSIYQQLLCLFKDRFPRQTPRSFGKQEFSLFGMPTHAIDIAPICVFTKDGRVCLDAGAAHGVCVDDEYAVYPPHLSNHEGKVPMKVKVSAVRGLNADLERVDQGSNEAVITTGWRAGALKYRTPNKIPVQLIVSADEQESWSAISYEKVFYTISVNDKPSPPCRFYVRSNEDMEYEFWDREGTLSTKIPSISRNSHNAYDLSRATLEHLTTCAFFEQIRNETPNSEFKSSFRIDLSDKSGNRFDANSPQDVAENEELLLRVENFGDKDIFICVFDLTPSYSVVDLLLSDGLQSVSGKQSRLIARVRKDPAPPNHLEETFEMEVPQSFKEQGLTKCKDVLKVFVTSRPSPFTQFWLPDVSLPADDPARHDVAGSSEEVEKASRAIRQQLYDPFEGDWWTENFYVHTYVAEETGA